MLNMNHPNGNAVQRRESIGMDLQVVSSYMIVKVMKVSSELQCRSTSEV